MPRFRPDASVAATAVALLTAFLISLACLAPPLLAMPEAAWPEAALAQVKPQDETERDDLLQQFGEAQPPADDLLQQFDAPAAPGDSTLLEQFAPEERPSPAEEAEPAGVILPRWAMLHGSISLNGAYNYAQEPPVPQRGLSRLRPLLRLDLTLDLPGSWQAQASGIAFHDYAYELKGEDKFTGEVLDQYQEEAELRELFVRGSLLPKLDLKEGRQIVVWGFADLIRVVDILNPIENREPGLADIEDVRLPIWMTRIDYYLDDFALQGVAVHEVAFNKDPVYGSDFFPADLPPPPEDKPAGTGGDTEYAFSLTGYFSGWDFALYYAEFIYDSAHLEDVSDNPMIPELRLRHGRLKMYGAGVNVAAGNWLLKGETALFKGLEFFNLPGKTKDRWDALAGFDYTGFTDTTITVEAVNRRILNFEPALEQEPDGGREDQNQYAFSYRGDFLHQTLHLVGVLFLFGDRGDEGGAQRYELAHDWFDAFTVTGGVLIFQSGGAGNPLFQRARNNDRLFFDIKYSF